MSDFVQQNSSVCSFKGSDSWVILSPIELSIKRKIEAVGTPLKDWDINIYRGILTGCNEAFIISGEKRDEILAKCETDNEREKTAELIRPILRGRDIKRYAADFADLWLIWIPWHFPLHQDKTIKGVSLKAEELFKIEYPSVYNYLLSYKPKLENRNKAETGIRYEWYALQRWGAEYWEDFSKPKIIFQEIVQESQFMYDVNAEYMCNDTCRIITGTQLDYLLKIFNSKLFFYSVKLFYGGGSLGECGVRMKHTFFQNFPCIVPSLENSESILTCDNTMDESQINQAIYKMYSLDNNEIDTIESL